MTEQSQGQQNPPANPPANTGDNTPPKWFTDWVATNKPEQNQTQQTPTANATPPAGQRGYGQDILNALNGLPEQLANAVKEMFPNGAPGQQQTQQGNQGDQGTEKVAEKQAEKPAEPGKKTFAERWFG